MNHKILSALVSLACMAAAGNLSYAQSYVPTPVTVSGERVKMGGRLFYSHVVLERQTVFAISKAYNVAPEDIYNANPGLRENGLKKNAVILIPVLQDEKRQDTQPVAAQDTDNAPKEDRGNAEKSRRQEARGGKKSKDEGKDEFFTHTVRWYEDLDVISEKYNVPVEVIMEINGLSGRKLKNRQKLRIPSDIGKYSVSKESAQAVFDKPAAKPEKEAEANAAEDKTEEKNIRFTTLFPKTTVNAVLMLPLDARDSTAGSPGNMDFYSGVLMAVREIGESGTNVDLSVYDVAGGKLPITVEKLGNSDIVIGPVSSADIRRVLEMTPKETYVISPLDHRAEAFATSYRNFIQAPTASSVQYSDLVQWIGEEKRPEDRVVVIFEKGTRNAEAANVISERLKEKGLDYGSFSYSILEGRDILDSLKTKMTDSAVNHLLVASESEAFVNDVVRNLNLMIYNKYKVTLYAPSKIRSFETIEVENLHNANLHVSASYCVDYDSPAVIDFIMKYRALFDTEPTPFAFQGYDTAKYFITLCAKYGDGWASVLESEKAEMLQSGFGFRRVKVGESEIGYINGDVRRIVYNPDFSVRIYGEVL